MWNISLVVIAIFLILGKSPQIVIFIRQLTKNYSIWELWFVDNSKELFFTVSRNNMLEF